MLDRELGQDLLRWGEQEGPDYMLLTACSVMCAVSCCIGEAASVHESFLSNVAAARHGWYQPPIGFIARRQ